MNMKESNSLTTHQVGTSTIRKKEERSSHDMSKVLIDHLPIDEWNFINGRFVCGFDRKRGAILLSYHPLSSEKDKEFAEKVTADALAYGSMLKLISKIEPGAKILDGKGRLPFLLFFVLVGHEVPDPSSRYGVNYSEFSPGQIMMWLKTMEPWLLKNARDHRDEIL